MHAHSVVFLQLDLMKSIQQWYYTYWRTVLFHPVMFSCPAIFILLILELFFFILLFWKHDITIAMSIAMSPP